MALELLLIEDSNAHAELVRRALAALPEPVSLRIAETVAAARTAIAEKQPDLVLLDVKLPDGTAMDILPGASEEAAFPVIVLTGHGDEVLAVACMKAGAMDYLVKSPETLRSITLTIQRIRNDWSRVLEHRRTLASLRESEERLHALFDEANDAMFVTDPETGLIVDVNNQAEHLMGMTRDELVGLHESLLHPKEMGSEARRIFSNPSAHAGKLIAEAEVETRKRGRVPVEISASTISLHNGKKIVLGIFRDVSKRRQLEDQLRQAQKMEAIGQLAGGVAHDFNNVLAAIMLQLGLLQSDNRIPSDISSSLTLLEAATKRASELTRQLLLFGRRQPAKLQPVDLDILLVNLLKMLRRLIGESIHLEFKPRPNSCWIFADPSMVEQIVMNLVVNARDAMPQGGRIVITTKIVDCAMPVTWVDTPSQSAPGSYVRLAITDTGCGMDEPVLKKLFEPFFTTKEQGKGTGLGLATAYGIVKQHHGWIDVRSEKGKGACFQVFLPLRLPMRAASGDGDQAMPVSSGCETVLLVEDDAIVRTFTSLSLRASGYTVLEASDGEEAMNVWNRHGDKVEVLLSDMIMPQGFSGWDLAKLMRKERPDLPVLLMSGYSDDLSRQVLERENSVVFLQKPFDMAKLTQALRTVLKGKFPNPRP
ncbi:MAG: response regulator [Opitutaceae bacterium]|jgi:hypothetical protein